jgi:hypothetical protein
LGLTLALVLPDKELAAAATPAAELEPEPVAAQRLAHRRHGRSLTCSGQEWEQALVDDPLRRVSATGSWVMSRRW